MTEGTNREAKTPSPFIRLTGGVICVLIVLCLLIGASSIPFVFESPSLLYKLGIDKVYLRSGKVLGMIGATLLLLQLPLAARSGLLDRVFTFNRLYSVHRINAVVIAVVALFHPLLVFAPEDIKSIPVELRYWPEVMGAVLLVLIWLIAATAIWRRFLDFSYEKWRLFHRVATIAAAVLLIFHVLFVSETFEAVRPRRIVYLTGSVYAAIYVYVKIKQLLPGKT